MMGGWEIEIVYRRVEVVRKIDYVIEVKKKKKDFIEILLGFVMEMYYGILYSFG